MLGSGSAGNSALVATDHCKILIDGGLSARQIVLRLEQCGVTPEQLDGALLTHEHGDHVCGLDVLCRKFDIPIYANSQTAEAIRYDGGLDRHRNWRIFRTGAEFKICDITVQTFPVPHDAVDPVGFAFYAGKSGLGFITDLGYATKMIVGAVEHRRSVTPAAEEMRIRDAMDSDLPAIIKIYNAAIVTRVATAQLEPVTLEQRRNWLKEHSPDRHPFWILEIDRQIAGWLTLKPFLPRGAYRGAAEVSVYVDEKFRRRGIARALLEEAIMRAPSLKI